MPEAVEAAVRKNTLPAQLAEAVEVETEAEKAETAQTAHQEQDLLVEAEAAEQWEQRLAEQADPAV